MLVVVNLVFAFYLSFCFFFLLRKRCQKKESIKIDLLRWLLIWLSGLGKTGAILLDVVKLLLLLGEEVVDDDTEEDVQTQ